MNMKQWYAFYTSEDNAESLISDMESHINMESLKLKQVASEIAEPKLKQVVSVLMFLTCFAYVPWGHHVMIMLCNITPKRIINSPIIEVMVIASLST